MHYDLADQIVAALALARRPLALGGLLDRVSSLSAPPAEAAPADRATILAFFTDGSFMVNGRIYPSRSRD